MSQFVYQAPGLPTDFEGFHLEFSEEGSRADIVFDRPPFNLISITQRAQMGAVFEALDIDPEVRVIVMRGAGEHFSRGDDTEEPIEMSPEDVARRAWSLSSPSRCSKPVIAANHGYCFGAGFEISLACDFRIVTETTLYALQAQKAGEFASVGGAACLHKLIGIGRTKDIVMRSRIICGVQAYDWGIATEFAVGSELDNVTDALVRELLAFSLFPQRAAKKLLNDIDDLALPIEIELERHGFG